MSVKYTDKETGEIKEFEFNSYQDLADKYMRVDLQIQTLIELKKSLMDQMRREYVRKSTE